MSEEIYKERKWRKISKDEQVLLMRKWKKENDKFNNFKSKKWKQIAAKRRSKIENELLKGINKFIVFACNRYHNLTHGAYSLEILISDAQFEIIKNGLRNWKEEIAKEKGTSFTTYIKYWIDFACKRSLSKQKHLIHIPENQYSKILKFKKENKELPNWYPRINSVDTSFLGKNKRKEDNDNNNDGFSIIDFYKSENEKDKYDLNHILKKKQLKEVVHKVFKKNNKILTDREKDIIYQRFIEEKELFEIRKKYKLSRQGINLIEKKAMMKLKCFFNKNYTDFKEFM